MQLLSVFIEKKLQFSCCKHRVHLLLTQFAVPPNLSCQPKGDCHFRIPWRKKLKFQQHATAHNRYSSFAPPFTAKLCKMSKSRSFKEIRNPTNCSSVASSFTFVVAAGCQELFVEPHCCLLSPWMHQVDDWRGAIQVRGARPGRGLYRAREVPAAITPAIWGSGG